MSTAQRVGAVREPPSPVQAIHQLFPKGTVKIPIKTVRGLKIRSDNGLEEHGFPDVMGTSAFLWAEPGDKLTLIDKNYKFDIASYQPMVEDKWIYTYDYSPNQAWVVYDRAPSKNECAEYIFNKKMYFRLCISRADGADLSDENINNILIFEKRDVLKFALLSDSHYVVNGTWDTTIAEIWVANRRIKLDGIIHLGDLTDGMLGKDICNDYVNLVLGDLRDIGVPVWVALGNHDYNYFRENKDTFTESELCGLYLNGNSPRYFVNFDTHKLCFIFLDSFDPDRELKYGYSDECVRWADETLRALPDDWNVIIFSHLTPLSKLQVWVERIYGETELMNVLTVHGDKILAFINGHQHTDHLFNDEAFPIISIGCAKCEYCLDYKPAGAVTPKRTLGDKTQELWDILAVDTAVKTLSFERQGSGKDRIVRNGKAEWIVKHDNAHPTDKDMTT